jgi:DNA-directed RNA polymerase subunit K/omega
VIQRPIGLNSFEFVILAGLRVVQLARGCTPRVNGSSKRTVIAQMEIAERKVVGEPKVGSCVLQPSPKHIQEG